ncbi:TauD/TfdA dioxygenase family protein [Sphingomonas montanisoli]|uniref:Taurine dioxygenase n=1 Tax=Sphingomonas montanisoli TaxID=2606412 RepID=A0A5D9CGB8_9SPHN|nr:TauD/TfdA family dioxygenase [Sphingomonas montanisoli]TZG29211.1 taurine dioxygenase [Sphingomonas montanisoli]
MIEVRKLTGAIGAEIAGIDLAGEISDEAVTTVMDALHDNYVVFFRNQKPLSEEEHIRAGRRFGVLDKSEVQPKPTAHPEILILDQMTGKGQGAELFHRDRTFLENPPLGSILQCMKKPDIGGDTCWASSVAAYEALSKPMQEFIDGLYATHSIQRLASRSQVVRDTLGDKIHSWPSAVHPLVEVHPVTGRKALNVNANWTTAIEGVSADESEMLLNFLFEYSKRPEFQVRFQWNLNDVAFWDNRTALHCAIADYDTRRIMKRVALSGHKPKGPRDIN